MIDEKKLIEGLNQVKELMVPNEFGKHTISIEAVVEFIENFPKSDGWIPCNERMPEDMHKFYDVSILDIRNGNKYVIEDYLFAMTDGRITWMKENAEHKVIAWREKLEPYQGDESNAI